MSFGEALQTLLNEDSALDAKRLARFVEAFKVNAVGRMLARTESGYVGLVPEEASIGDTVYHILGSRWPVVLRPSRDQSYTVVGYAYIDGMNDREAFLGRLPEEFTRVATYDQPTDKWWPAYLNKKTDKLQIEDPRVGPLPEGWIVKKRKEGHLWNWYVMVGDDARGSEDLRTELRWRSDPKLKAGAMRQRGVVVQNFLLV